MISLSPEQLSIIKSISTNIPNQVSAALRVNTDLIQDFINNIIKFVTGANTLHTSFYLIVLDFRTEDIQNTDRISEALIQRHFSINNRIFFVDNNLNLKKTVDGPVKICDSEKIIADNNSFGILIHGTYFYYILCGKCIEEGDIISPSVSAPWPSNLYRPMSEFPVLLTDHKNNWVDDERGFTYWADKKKRLLRASPEKTESIFHRSLLSWLRLFLTDSLRIFSETQGFGQGKIDICIVTHSGSYVIELKWLGKNEKNTEYGQEKINEGIIQIKIYLEKEEYICGYLVLYDGRSHQKHKDKSGYDEELLHSKCIKPIIIFLESETPSEKARRLIKLNS